MTASVRSRIIDAVVARLEAGAELRALRARVRRDVAAAEVIEADGSVDRRPVVAVIDRGESGPVEPLMGAVAERRILDLDIEGIVVVGGVRPELGAAREALRAGLLRDLVAERTLDGLVVDMTAEGFDVSIDDVAGHGPGASFSQSVSIEYWIKPGDPYTAAP